MQKGKFSAGTWHFVIVLNRVLFPTFGNPTMPILRCEENRPRTGFASSTPFPFPFLGGMATRALATLPLSLASNAGVGASAKALLDFTSLGPLPPPASEVERMNFSTEKLPERSRSPAPGRRDLACSLPQGRSRGKERVGEWFGPRRFRGRRTRMTRALLTHRRPRLPVFFVPPRSSPVFPVPSPGASGASFALHGCRRDVWESKSVTGRR